MGSLYEEFLVALHAIWARRWIALGVAWAVAIAGWLVVSQIPNSYESDARVFVQLQSALPDSVGINAADQQKDVDTVRSTLVSAVNLEKVVRGTDLAKTVASDRDVADRAASLQKAITITAEQDNLFKISADAASPKIAQQVVQKLIDIFVDQNLAGDRDQNQQTLAFLDAQLAQRQKQLQDADAKRSAFENQFLAALPGTGSLTDRLGAARSAMAQVDSDLAAAQSGLSAVNGQMAGTPASTPGDAVAAGPARARLAAIQGQLSEARARGFTDNHPDVIALKSQLAAAQAAARAEPVSAGASATNPLYLSLKSMQADKQAQVAALMVRKQQLQGTLDQINAKLNTDPAVAAEQGDIERNYQVLKDQYDKLLADRESVRIRAQAQTQTDAVKFTVTNPPSLSSVPAAPKRPLLLTGVLIAALCAGIGVAFGLSQIRRTFATPARLERETGMPVLGSVGQMLTRADVALQRQYLTWFAGGAAALVAAWVALLGVEMIQRGLAA